MYLRMNQVCALKLLHKQKDGHWLANKHPECHANEEVSLVQCHPSYLFHWLGGLYGPGRINQLTHIRPRLIRVALSPGTCKTLNQMIFLFLETIFTKPLPQTLMVLPSASSMWLVYLQ